MIVFFLKPKSIIDKDNEVHGNVVYLLTMKQLLDFEFGYKRILNSVVYFS